MLNKIEVLIRQTILAIGDHRDETIVVENFRRQFVAAQRKALVVSRCKWISFGAVGLSPWWWPEEWAIGAGVADGFEFIRSLFMAPILVESAINHINHLIG